MNSMPKLRSLLLLAALAPVTLMLLSTDVCAQTARGGAASVLRRDAPQDEKEKMNAWTVGLAGGLLEGAPLRLAAEMARVVDDGPNLHVLPIVTRGATENLNSLLYLRGVDTAIINSDALEEYKIQVPEIRRRISYLLNLFPSELHIFVRPEIESLQDLAGKKVNFNTQGTAAAYSGPLIFSRLGINAENTFIPHQVALEQMRKGEMAAVVFITSKPVDAFVRGRWEPGFKFLPVKYDSKLEDYYLPAVLEAAEYPSLIKQGERCRRLRCRPRLSRSTGRQKQTAISASLVSSMCFFRVSTGCRHRASTRNGNRSISLRPFLASSALRRRKNGSIVRRAHRERRDEGYPPVLGIRNSKRARFRASRGRSDGASSRLRLDGARGAAGMPG